MFVLLFLIGIVDLVAPEAAWYLGGGWKFKDAEPSDAALVLTRIGGGICILIGFIMLFK